MAAVRRPLFWIPMFLGVLIGVVAAYLTRPSQTDAQTSRPSLTSLQQQIDTLSASVGALNTSVGDLNDSVATVEGDILDIVTGTVPVGAVDGQVKVGTFDGPADASSAGRLRWGPATQQLEQSDGTQWAPIALDRAPIIWSGGSTTHGTATGWNTYLLNGLDFNTAAGYLQVVPSGTITVETPEFGRLGGAPRDLATSATRQAFVFFASIMGPRSLFGVRWTCPRLLGNRWENRIAVKLLK